jgi:anti-anti-sigma factor
MSVAVPLVRLGAPVIAVAPVATVATDAVRASLVLQGELDVAVAALLAAEIDAHFAAGRRYLRADCSAVEFVDSAVLSVLVRAHRDALSRRGTLILTGVRPALDRLLAVVGLDRVLLTTPATAANVLVAP